MNIRKTTMADLLELMELFKYAREQMKKNGNPTQWGDTKPTQDMVEQDIRNGNSYVIQEDGAICGTFALLIGEDPTYLRIDQGEWLNDHPYGTIHRIASNGTKRGIFQSCLEYCGEQIADLRIDTHENNRVMQRLITAGGFKKCGIIYLADGSPRIAFHKASGQGGKDGITGTF